MEIDFGKERFEQVLPLLPEGLVSKAKELDALQRTREIKTPEELLRLILLYLTEGKSTVSLGDVFCPMAILFLFLHKMKKHRNTSL